MLIELLASKNQAPLKGQRGHAYMEAEPPAGYSKRDQVIVFLAIQQLLQEGDNAFDSLMDHLEDKRYSVSYDSPSGIFDSTVGSICTNCSTRHLLLR